MLTDVALNHLELEDRFRSRVKAEGQADLVRGGVFLQCQVVAAHVVLQPQLAAPLDEALPLSQSTPFWSATDSTCQRPS